MSTATASTTIVREPDLCEADLHFYQDYGYLLIPQFVQAEALPQLRQEVLTTLQEACGISAKDLHQASQTADKLRQCNQYLSGSALDALINGPASLATASFLVEGQAHRYTCFTAAKAAGGGGEFHMHQDNNYTKHDPAMGSINIWVALVDMTPSNGCLHIVPGSHKLGSVASVNSPDGDQHQTVAEDVGRASPVRMRAGDAVAFSRLTVHGSGPNNSTAPRLAYALQYHREDVRWRDPETDEWHLNLDKPRFEAPPLNAYRAR